MAEKEFSFKDFIFYALNRWFYVVLATVICTVAMIGFSAFQEGRQRETQVYQASLVMCDIETYSLSFSAGTAPDPLLLGQAYNENLKRAIDAMTNKDGNGKGRNDFAFLQDEGNQASLRTMLKKPSADIPAMQTFLKQNVLIQENSYSVTLGISFLPQETGWNPDHVKKVLDDYARFMESAVYKKVDRFAIMKAEYDGDPDGKSRPITLVAADLVEAESAESQLFRSAALGAVVGIVIGFLIILVLYLADPRLKSAEELSRAGFEVVSKSNDTSSLTDALAVLTAKLNGLKTICVFESGCAAGAGKLTNTLSVYLQKIGHKVLVVDAGGTGGSLQKLLTGSGSAVETIGGVARLTFTEPDDSSYLLAKRERFLELIKNYDKVLFICDAAVGGALQACSSFTDGAICVADKTKAKTNDIYASANVLGESVKTMLGVVYASESIQKS